MNRSTQIAAAIATLCVGETAAQPLDATRLPHPATLDAYRQAKRDGYDDLDAWWAAFHASPARNHDEMFQDATAAAAAYQQGQDHA